MEEHLAKYIKACPENKKQAAQLTSSNSIVGNLFSLKINSKKQQVTIVNKFNYEVAMLNKDDAKQVILQNNKGYKLACLLAYVTFCEPKSQHCAIFLIISYNKKYEDAYKNFIENVGYQLSIGNRPNVKLDKYDQDIIVKLNGNTKIDKFLKKPKLEHGTVIVKGKQTFLEKIIEAGRQKNPGCYVLSILFLLIIAFLIF